MSTKILKITRARKYAVTYGCLKPRYLKGYGQWPIYKLMYIHNDNMPKITPPVDYNQWLKQLDT